MWRLRARAGVKYKDEEMSVTVLHAPGLLQEEVSLCAKPRRHFPNWRATKDAIGSGRLGQCRSREKETYTLDPESRDGRQTQRFEPDPRKSEKGTYTSDTESRDGRQTQRFQRHTRMKDKETYTLDPEQKDGRQTQRFQLHTRKKDKETYTLDPESRPELNSESWPRVVGRNATLSFASVLHQF